MKGTTSVTPARPFKISFKICKRPFAISGDDVPSEAHPKDTEPPSEEDFCAWEIPGRISEDLRIKFRYY